MASYRFQLATPADDADLRSILQATPMPGALSVAFERNPSYWGAAVVEGHETQAILVRDPQTGAAVAMGARSIAQRYVNGQPAPVGYLSNLRIVPDHRQRGVLARGYRFLHGLHADGKADFYLTTIASDNEQARKLLASSRAGLPTYQPYGQFHTAILPIKGRPASNPHDLTLRLAEHEDKPLILDFIHQLGKGRQFFPCYTESDLFTEQGLLRGLRPQDLLLAFRGKTLAGILGAWDQNSFRQIIVRGYSASMSFLRPVYNVYARFARLPSLPPVGATLPCLHAALPLAMGDDPGIFSMLLDTVLSQTARGNNYLLIGFHDSDPLLPVLRRYPARWYTTDLYLVSWRDTLVPRLDQRPVYLELGGL